MGSIEPIEPTLTTLLLGLSNELQINVLAQGRTELRGGVRVGSMGSIEPTDFWSL